MAYGLVSLPVQLLKFDARLASETTYGSRRNLKWSNGQYRWLHQGILAKPTIPLDSLVTQIIGLVLVNAVEIGIVAALEPPSWRVNLGAVC